MSQNDDPRLRFDFPPMVACDSLPSFSFRLEQGAGPFEVQAAEIDVIDRRGRVVFSWATPETLAIVDGVITSAPIIDTSIIPYGDHRHNLKLTLPDGQKRSVAHGSFKFLRR